MPLEICPCCKSDAEATTRLKYDAFQDDDPISKLMYPVPVSESILVATSALTLKSWGEDPTNRRMQVKDSDTGEVISFSSWLFYPQREGEDWKKMPEFHWPEGWYHDNASALHVKQIEARNRIMGPKPYLYLGSLATSPTQQRRGAASMLLKWGIARAQALNLPVFLTATAAGLPLYRKHGFQAVGEITIDTSLFNPSLSQNQIVPLVCMLLPAPSPSLPPSPDYPAIPAPTTFWPINISPVTEPREFSTLVAVESAGFATDPLMILAFPPGPSPSEDHDFRTKVHFDSKSIDPSNHYAKAVDPLSGAIVGWSKWHFYDDLSREHYVFPKEPPPNANVPLLDAVLGRSNKLRESLMAGKEYAYCTTLVVDPEWQRRGIGRRLLQGVLSVLDEKGWEAYIDASPAGLGLYKQLGWEEVGRQDVDQGAYGGEKGVILTNVSLVRKPKRAVEEAQEL